MRTSTSVTLLILACLARSAGAYPGLYPDDGRWIDMCATQTAGPDFTAASWVEVHQHVMGTAPASTDESQVAKALCRTCAPKRGSIVLGARGVFIVQWEAKAYQVTRLPIPVPQTPTMQAVLPIGSIGEFQVGVPAPGRCAKGAECPAIGQRPGDTVHTFAVDKRGRLRFAQTCSMPARRLQRAPSLIFDGEFVGYDSCDRTEMRYWAQMKGAACTPVILKRAHDLMDQIRTAAVAGDAAAVDHFFGPMFAANPSDEVRLKRAHFRMRAGNVKGAYADCSIVVARMKNRDSKVFKTQSAWCARAKARIAKESIQP